MLRAERRRARHLIVALVLLGIPRAAWSQNYADAAKQLTGRIATIVPQASTLELSIENRSSLAAGEVDALRSLIEADLRAAGVAIGGSDVKLPITISEDPSQFLIVAQAGEQVIIASWKKPPPAAIEYAMTIHREPVFEQQAPILDLMLTDNGAGMLVLEPERVAQYSRNGAQWQLVHATTITPSRPMPRDPRGRLLPAVASGAGKSGFAVSEPGRNDSGQERFPYHWFAGRNYFEGGDRGDFYTAANTPGGTVLAGIDGRARLYGSRPEPLLTINDWGSDVAVITSACGSKTQVLATAPTTDGAADRLQAFEFTASAYTPASEPVLAAGPITALWTAESPDQVTMVVHDRQTGMYEASRLSIRCGQ